MKALILFLLLPLELLAQDISGVWTGFIHTEGNDLVYEMVISENKEKTNGYSLMIFPVNGVENIGVKSVILKKKKGNISIEDDELVYDNYTTTSARVKLFALLSLNIQDSIMTLSGKFHTRSFDLRSSNNNSYTGTIDLKKQKDTANTKLASQLDRMRLLNSLVFVQQKKQEEKRKLAIITVQSKKPQPVLPQEKEKDSVILTTIRNPVIGIPNQGNNRTDSTLKKETTRDVIVPLVKTKSEETPVIALAQKQLSVPKEKEPVVDSNSKKISEKINEEPIVEKKPLVKKETIVVNNAAAAITERKTEIIRNVYFKTDSLILTLYDNGTVDGDTVSVVLNGNIIIAKKGLTANALRVVVQTTPDLGDSLLLTMYAENLGSIPPNTGLLIIQDGDDRNEIRFEGDTHKNSAVILRRKR